MKELIIYYSFGGKCRAVAEAMAKEQDCDLLELAEPKKRGMVSALLIGCPKAMKMSPVPLKPVECDMTRYESFILIFPIWANFPAPPFNNAVAMLPKGARAELVMVSGSGDSSKSRPAVEKRLAEFGVTVTGYRDIKSE